MDAECIHLIDPATCTICNGSDRKRRLEARREAEAISYVFPAKWDTACMRCQDRLWVGASVYRMGDGSLVCSDCATLAAP